MIILIKELGELSIKLNNQLIDIYNLKKFEELKNTQNIYLPIVALGRKIIPYKGEFISFLDEKVIRYNFHGSGITFSNSNFTVSFEYYPDLKQKGKPIFGIMSLFTFIESKGISLSKKDKIKIDALLCTLQEQNLILFLKEGFGRYYIN